MNTFVVTAPPIEIPITAAAPVLEKVPMVLLVTVEVVPLDPIAIPVIAPEPVILVMVFPDTRFPFPPLPPPKEELIPTIVLEPPVMLLMMLFVML